MLYLIFELSFSWYITFYITWFVGVLTIVIGLLSFTLTFFFCYVYGIWNYSYANNLFKLSLFTL